MHWYQQVPHYQRMQRELDPDKPCTFFLPVGLHETNNIFIWRQSINRSLSKCVIRLCFHLVLSFAPISLTLPNLHFTKMFCFPCMICLCVFWFIVQTLRICCDAWQCIFSSAYSSYEVRVITLPFVGYCVMIDAEQSTGHFILTRLVRKMILTMCCQPLLILNMK